MDVGVDVAAPYPTDLVTVVEVQFAVIDLPRQHIHIRHRSLRRGIGTIAASTALANAIGIPVIASGGITDLDDIRRLHATGSPGITGAITGRAIYEGTLDFTEGQALADRLWPADTST